MSQGKQSFLGGAALLTVTMLITKAIGALYKIPLGNLLDEQGMNYFYAAYNIYNLLLMVSTAGLPLALSRLVSQAEALGPGEPAAAHSVRGLLAVSAAGGRQQRRDVLPGRGPGRVDAQYPGGERHPGAVSVGAVRVPGVGDPGLYPGPGRHAAHRRQRDHRIRQQAGGGPGSCLVAAAAGISLPHSRRRGHRRGHGRRGSVAAGPERVGAVSPVPGQGPG